MNIVQIKQTATVILTNLASYLVAKGYITTGMAADFATVGVTMLGLFLAWKFGSTENAVAAAAQSSRVSSITVTSPELANAVGDNSGTVHVK